MNGSDRTHRETVFYEIHNGLPREGYGLDVYTRRAWEMLPALEDPHILDIGCGPGNQTIELARLSGGRVKGLDNNPPYLDALRRKIAAAELTDRVEAVEGTMFDLTWDEGAFDVIWSESAIYIIGFEKGLQEWKRYLRPGGFLAVSELAWLRSDVPAGIREYWEKEYPAITTVANNCAFIEAAGYTQLGHFVLPEDAWWKEYYHPLEERLSDLRFTYRDNPEALEIIAAEQREIDLYREYSDWFGAVFFIMQRD